MANVPATPPLLRLPPHLRRRIYFWAGMAPLQRDGAPLIIDLHGAFDTSRLGFYGLLLSCRAIYAEASTLLYSLNRFVIRMPPSVPYGMYFPQGRGLAPLRALSNSSLASLRHLKIIISEASCHPRESHLRRNLCCYFSMESSLHGCTCQRHEQVARYGPVRVHPSPRYERPPRADSSLQAGDDFTGATLAEWRSTAAHLSSRGVSLADLELSLVCDVRPDAPQLARLAVAPLASLAPLKNCHVRLCRDRSAEIQGIADDAVLYARSISTGRPAGLPVYPPRLSHRGSRLLALPRELRLRILEHTDLITPWREVTWDRRSSKYSASRVSCVCWRCRLGVCPPRVHHGCQFSTCWLYLPEPSIGCFCRLRHSASSSACRCWGSPLALFLVCRALCHDAQVVFFSGNRFVVHDFSSSTPWLLPPLHPEGGYPTARFAISVFLRDIVPAACLSLLRFVEMVFPAYPHDSWPRKDDLALQEWIACVTWLRDKVNPLALTLRLYMAGMRVVDFASLRREVTKKQGQEILKGYGRILRPLSQLGGVGLARFHAHFEWPWRHTSEVKDRVIEERSFEWLEQEEALLKVRAERWVMGDRYDTLYGDGKEPPESLWKILLDSD